MTGREEGFEALSDAHEEDEGHHKPLPPRPLYRLPTYEDVRLYLIQQYKDGNVKLFLYFVIWLATGTIFYAKINFEGDYAKGFFYSISNGYSIGWGLYGNNTDLSKVFSIFYVLVGAVFATRAIVSLLDNALQELEATTADQLAIRQYLEQHTKLKGMWKEYHIWAVVSSGRFFVVYLWLVYIFFGAFWTCALVKWSFLEGVFFSVTSLSTGGIYMFPLESSSTIYGLAGLYAMFGVPLMALAMANIAQLVVEAQRIEKLRKKKSIKKFLSDKERAFLALLGIHSSGSDSNASLLFMLLKKGLVSKKDVTEAKETVDAIHIERIAKRLSVHAGDKYGVGEAVQNPLIPTTDTGDAPFNTDLNMNGIDSHSPDSAPTAAAQDFVAVPLSEEQAEKENPFEQTSLPQQQNNIFPSFQEVKQYLKQIYKDGTVRILVYYAIWLVTGTIFYAHEDFEGDYAKGFYYSINNGYSIGWGILGDYTKHSKTFSIFYVLAGAIFVTRAIVSLLDHTLLEHESSTAEQLSLRQYLEGHTKLKGMWKEYHLWAVLSSGRFFVVYIWLVYIFLGAAWSCALVGWNLLDGVFFAVTSLSGGGIQSFPEDSSSTVYIVCGVYAAIGLPLMVLAMTNVAQLIVEAHRIEKLRKKKSIKKFLSDKERAFLALLGIHSSGTSASDRNASLLFMLLKKGLVSKKDVTEAKETVEAIHSERITKRQSLHGDYNAVNSDTVQNPLIVEEDENDMLERL